MPPPRTDDSTQFFESHPNEIDSKVDGDSILFANKHIGLEVVKGENGFQINRFYSIDQDQEFLAQEPAGVLRELFEIRMTPDIRGSGRDRRGDSTKPGLMGIMDEMAADAFSVGSQSMPTLTKIPKTGDLLVIWNHSTYDADFDHCGKRTPLTVAISKDEGKTWENIQDIETDPNYEFTNASCHFTRQDKVIIMYEASKMDNPDPPGRLGRSSMPLKAAVADVDWFYA